MRYQRSRAPCCCGFVGIASLFASGDSQGWLAYLSIAVPALLTPAVYFKVTFRVMGPHERGRFAPEAWGHLLALSGSGVLNAAEFEHVIERALAAIDGRIALDDLRAMMEGAGLSDDGSAGSHLTVH